jgi:predicted glycoside hydrolase/deacetylase ChbG (UPF0249 family)
MQAQKIKLCINADDFGFSPAISKGILELMQAGVVSSTSIMPLTCQPGEAAALAAMKNCSAGFHFSLTSGNNRYIENIRSPRMLAAKIYAGKIKEQDLLKELEHQYQTLCAIFSRELSHIDTHQHIHILPRVATAIHRFLIGKKIPYFRIGKEFSPTPSIKKLLFNTTARNKNYPFPIMGLNLMGEKFTEAIILKHLVHLKKNNIQKAMWIVHPGYPTDKAVFTDSYNDEREQELNTLLKMKDTLCEWAEIVPLPQLLSTA